MKRIILLGIVTLMFSVTALHAQKYAHINTEELIAAMPESDSAMAQIQQEATSLEQTLEELQVEYNNKLEQYLADREKLSQVIIQNKEAELQSLQQRIQNFEASASQSIQELRAQLFQPVLDKANKAISDVAQEKGYTYVFDSSTGVLIYMSENAIDILPDVKAKLGL